MSIETVLYRPARVRYAKIGALIGLTLVFSHYVLGQGGASMNQWTLDLWIHNLVAAVFLVGFFVVSAYAIGSYKDRNPVGPTVRVATFPVRQRWACYGAVAGFLMGMAQFIDLSGDGNLQAGVEAAASQTVISPLASTAFFALVFYVIGRVRDHYTGQF